MVTKRLQLLKEIRPEISRVAVLWNPDAPAGGPPSVLKATQEAARILQLKLQVLEVRAQVPSAIEQAFHRLDAKTPSTAGTISEPTAVDDRHP